MEMESGDWQAADQVSQWGCFGGFFPCGTGIGFWSRSVCAHETHVCCWMGCCGGCGRSGDACPEDFAFVYRNGLELSCTFHTERCGKSPIRLHGEMRPGSLQPCTPGYPLTTLSRNHPRPAGPCRLATHVVIRHTARNRGALVAAARILVCHHPGDVVVHNRNGGREKRSQPRRGKHAPLSNGCAPVACYSSLMSPPPRRSCDSILSGCELWVGHAHQTLSIGMPLIVLTDS